MTAAIIYSLIGIIIILIIIGALSRKKIYKEVDRLEQWKMKIMNEPVTEEISKIKGLTMSGETEQRFEAWRSEWDDIVTHQLPDVEEKLFDIEESVNKYRFRKGKKLLVEVDYTLAAIETHMKNMIKEIDELVESEERNREEISEVQHYYDETKKKLWMKRSTLGEAGLKLDQMMKEVHGSFDVFQEQTTEGNYLLARETLEAMKESLKEINRLIEDVPPYLVLLEKELPKQLTELSLGLKEMEAKGFAIEHFSFGSQITKMKQELDGLFLLLEEVKVDEVKEPIQDIQSEIEGIYETLEYEALSKQVVTQEVHELAKRVDLLPETFRQLLVETEEVKMSYRITEEDYKSHLKIEKTVKELLQQFVMIEDYIENQKQSYTALRKMVSEFKEKLEAGERDLFYAKEVLEDMRSDERKAEETLRHLRQKLISGQKKLQKSNIPGLPRDILEEMDTAEKYFIQASNKIDEVPLSIDEVTHHVDQAHDHIENVMAILHDVIEKATLAERVIQYGNRYRRQNDRLNILLLQSEEAFRNYQYEEALEMSLKAIKPIDPNVLENVQKEETLQPSV
ncbi:septation ring formation regulator EzrA [Alteribacter aurantiacus]|uniref:septation ring formation regulator EzrA n=1 Tax=Alteribacter aurantiacus TaxID=254410 RepID=UPI0004135EC4|nr:septation ring formation regulator EzrA [Alteribacter aurantiacus]